jgi:hypothetical protein
MHTLPDKFTKMGARAVIEAIDARSQRLRHATLPRFSVDIQSDRQGEYFLVRKPADVAIEVLDLWPRDRHLLLMARHQNAERTDMPRKSKFLCGHDERHWFVAAVPEDKGVSNVQQAMDALKPQAVWDSMSQHGVPMEDRNQRRTAGFVRQGEWFFLPRPQMQVQRARILKDEPLRRGAGKPHFVDQLYREGGESVYFAPAYPNGLTLTEYSRLSKEERDRHRWRRMQRDPRAFVRGRVRHRDHATIVLDVWHEVVMNTETRAFAMRNVAFLD